MGAGAALVLLIPALPIALWALWSDLKFMKIPNRAVLALAFAFLVLGPFLLPLSAYGLALGLGAGVLVAGFLLSTAGLLGAGDAKFAAAMAPYFIGADLAQTAFLLGITLIAGFLTHRLIRRSPLRRLAPDWLSWTHPQFPMGLSLGVALILHLALTAAPGFPM